MTVFTNIDPIAQNIKKSSY